MYLIKYIKNSLSKLLNAAGRFPLVTLSAVLSFVFVLFYFHFYSNFELSRRTWIFIAFECVVGISLFLAFALFAEKYKVDVGKRIGLGLMGLCILGLHYFALPNWAINIDATYFLRFFTFWIIFSLLVSFVLFYKEKDKLAFWQYNQYIVIQYFLSSTFSLALFIGLASSLFAIEKIFEISLNEAYYVDLFAFLFIVVNTLFFSASLPNNLDAFKEPHDFRKPLRIFIQYVLLPVLLIFYVILIVFFGKVVLTGNLTEGWVALPILLFSVIGTLTFFLAYPYSYEKQFTSIRFFVTYFFYFLLPLIALLAASLLTRIFDYGFTEYRYLGLLIGIWLVIISFYTILRNEVSLVLFPISLFLLLFLGSVGPWGMFQMSARSQYNRLSNIVENADMMDGKVLSVNKLQANLTDSLRDEIGSINKYLFYREKIDLIYPMLAEREKKQIDSIRTSDNKIGAFNAFLSKTFNLSENYQLPDYRRYHFYAAETRDFQLDVKDYSSFQSFNFSSDNKKDSVQIYMDKTELTLVSEIDTFSFTLFPYLDSLTAYYFSQPDLTNLPFDEYVNIQTGMNNMTFETQDEKSKIIFKEFLFRRSADSSIYLENTNFYFFK